MSGSVVDERELPRRKRLIVCVPLSDHIRPKFFQGWLSLKLGGIRVETVTGYYPAQAHQALVVQALRVPSWEVAVFLETDHLFPPNVLERMSYYPVDAVVGALYNLREPPHQPCAFVPVDELMGSEKIWAGQWSHGDVRFAKPSEAVGWLQEDRLYRVLAVGMGCTAVPRSLLEAWPADEPFFFASQELSRAGRLELVTDDMYFCRRAAQLGCEIYVDGGLHIEHIGDRQVTMETHLEHREKEARAAGLFDADPDRVEAARQRILETL